MKNNIFYLNLTNGLEALPQFYKDYKTIRIQSTACEQKRWDYILSDLDNGFLFDLAIGKNCFIIDYSQRKQSPRALFQGVEWIRFVLYKIWLQKEYKPMVRGNDSTKYFLDIFKTIKPNTIKKIKYYQKFVRCNEINIITISGKTKNDGDFEFYNQLIKNYVCN